MGISKTQLMSAVQKLKDYTDNTLVASELSADFLTDDGFGGLRYHNGVIQYWNGSSWIDAAATSDNTYIINMSPQPMKSFIVQYNSVNQKYQLKWTEPDDTVVDGQTLCTVDGVLIRRKLGSAPADEKDGQLVIDLPRRQFGSYKTEWYSDDTCTAQTDDVWYYKAFPYSTLKFYGYSKLNEGSALCKDYELYAFKINQAESNPASMITYPIGCDNENYASAYMDYSAGVFNYGDWKDAFFMQVKPCMLKYDGTVDYYLDPNDYSRKVDGTASDVANLNYEGNVMVEFPKVYYKGIVDNDNVATYYFSNKKLDDDYKCWAHLDANGEEIPYCYISAYTVNINSNLIQAKSGLQCVYSSNITSIKQKVDSAYTNPIWGITPFCDEQLLTLLLLLIGKNNNSQQTFGNGNCSSGSSTAWITNPSDSRILKSGTLNTNGLFFGYSTSTKGVKVFGIENLWGNAYRIILGEVVNNKKKYVKMTYSDVDGTSVGYNLDGSNYIDTYINTSTSSWVWIKKAKLSQYYIIPESGNASSSTYYCDGTSIDSNVISLCVKNCFPRPDNDSPNIAGLFCEKYYTPTANSSTISTGISCKPLKGAD